jgi:hypothetical protein
MDDLTREVPVQAPAWEPHIGMDGRYQVFVTYMHDNGRYVSGSVTLDRYLALFSAGSLKWQREGEERPEHNPSREEALSYTAIEKAKSPDW